MKPTQEMLLAGIIGKGCNIGLNRIANISVGISKDVLNNTVNWFFDLKNLQRTSDKIVGYIDKLSLAILKSHFILTYFDDVILRQRVEKQLNRVELSNKFAKAIFFANNQELHEGAKSEH